MRRVTVTLGVVAGAMAPAAGAATLEAPRGVGIGDSFAVVGRGLERADGYVLTLGAPRLRGSPSTCGARIGGRRDATGARTVFSGRVPRYLPCHLPDGTRVGRQRVTPGGGYSLTVCVPTNPVLCDGDTFAARRVRILRAGRACRRVVFEERSENLASRIRAGRVSCRRARAVASRSSREAARCFGRGGCSYRAEGFRCRGTADEAELPTLVFRCTRRRARVTFVKT